MLLENWTAPGSTPAGIGIDLVEVEALKALDARTKGAFAERTFSEAERREAETAADPWVYYAGRFAAKEAVFKAVAHLLPEKTFDLRLTQTLRDPDGSPRIVVDSSLRTILDNANVSCLLISITNEAGFAAAIVQAVAYSSSDKLPEGK